MSKEKRQTWDEYFMNIARMVATRSTCPRKFVGAVIVKNNNILSTGYNGSMSGAPHCTDVGCMMEGDHCVATIHAESNAIIHSARHGISMEGSTAPWNGQINLVSVLFISLLKTLNFRFKWNLISAPVINE
jgi:deoxycytidylate deaminase